MEIVFEKRIMEMENFIQTNSHSAYFVLYETARATNSFRYNRE